MLHRLVAQFSYLLSDHFRQVGASQNCDPDFSPVRAPCTGFCTAFHQTGSFVSVFRISSNPGRVV